VVERTKIERSGAGATAAGEDGAVLRFTGDELVSMNMWGFTPALFAQLKIAFAEFLRARGREEKSECYIPSVVNDLIRTGAARARVLRTNAPWFGVTYREDRPFVVAGIRELIARGEYPEQLWA